MPGIGLKNGTETYSKIYKYRKRPKNKQVTVIYIYISFTVNHVLHPAFLPHFTWSIYAYECKIPIMQGQVPSILESYSHLKD